MESRTMQWCISRVFGRVDIGTSGNEQVYDRQMAIQARIMQRLAALVILN
jgi:hypothetical protein